MDQILKFSVARLLTSSAAVADGGNAGGSSTTNDDDATSNSPNNAASTNNNNNNNNNNTNLLIHAANVIEQQQQQQTFSQVLYDSMMLNALLLHLDNNQRQAQGTASSGQFDPTGSGVAPVRRNFVEFYQPSQSSHHSASGNSHDRLLLAIADSCPPVSSSSSHGNSNVISQQQQQQQSAPLLAALGSSLWQPSVNVSAFHPTTLMTVDTPPLRPRKAAPRAVFSMLQRRGLERYFQQHKYISRTERRRISATLGLTDVQVKIWFQNRRMKWRQNSMPPEMAETASNHQHHSESDGTPSKKGSDVDGGCSSSRQHQHKHNKIDL